MLLSCFGSVHFLDETNFVTCTRFTSVLRAEMSELQTHGGRPLFSVLFHDSRSLAEAAATPGPGAHFPVDRPFSHQRALSSLISDAPRLAPVRSDAPPVGKYDPLRSLEAIAVRPSAAAISAALPRFPQPSKLVLPTPGPADYSTAHSSLDPSGASAFGRAAKLPEVEPPQVPGPGAYALPEHEHVRDIVPAHALSSDHCAESRVSARVPVAHSALRARSL